MRNANLADPWASSIQNHLDTLVSEDCIDPELGRDCGQKIVIIRYF